MPRIAAILLPTREPIGARLISAGAHFHAVDGQDEDDEWGCRMKIADGAYTDYWLDSSDGYVCAVGSSSQRWKFLGNGDHYEWWQDERPVVITDTGPAAADCAPSTAPRTGPA
ncbi:hypothetical protein [Nonomuraea sp. NPDC005650]|uniref:hypothetical protein n=1 Tax=Nonomuraea sp. NPDC005650 TaxID=3157045 RepID=UPI0033B17EFD